MPNKSVNQTPGGAGYPGVRVLEAAWVLRRGLIMDLMSAISLFVGVIGTALAIYQAAVIRETKNRYRELQYILAGISNMALGKQQAWVNQGYWLGEPDNDEVKEIYKLHARARDDFAEMATTISALEGTIDPDHSAITKMLEKMKTQISINNELQREGLKNPTLKRNEGNECE